MTKFQTGFFMHWAETTEILGRVEKFQTGTPQFILRGGDSKYMNTVIFNSPANCSAIFIFCFNFACIFFVKRLVEL